MANRFSLLVVAFLYLSGIHIPAIYSQVEYAKPWEKGVNICAYIARDGILDYKICPHCLPWKMEYGKKMTKFLYDCCPGFKRTDRFENKCVERERTWKLIPGLLRDHKMNKFADYIVHPRKGAGFGIIDNNKTAATFTVISPFNRKAMKKAEVDYPKFKGQKEHPILFHVVKGRYYMKDFRNGMVLKSEYKGQNLKVTKYSNGIICIECKELVEPDHEARNGVVHYFAAPLTPHDAEGFRRSSVKDLLENNPDTQSFASSLPDNVKKALSGSDSCKWFTVFAPNKEAWDKIKKDYGDRAGQIAANHILRRGMYCKAAMISRINKLGPTFADEHLQVDCNARGNRMVRSGCGSWSVVTKADLMAGNGVVHIINKALMPLKAMSMEQAIQASCYKGNEMWMRYLKECDLRMSPGSKYAVLIPMNRAFNWWKNYARFKKYYDRFQTDAAFRCRLIRFHIFRMTDERATALQNLWLQQEGYETNNIDRLWEVDYFLKMYYGSMLYFHYSPVRDLRSFRFEGGSVFFIDRVNMIPEQTIIQILPTRPDFSITTKYTRKAKMDPNVFQRNIPLNLYLVVRDGGYSASLQKQLNSKTYKLDMFLLLHWVQLYLWGGDIGYFENGTRHRFMSGAKVELIFDRETDGTMYIGYEGLDRAMWARVVEWNLFAIDGMIWVLDKPLPCPSKLCKVKLIEKEIWKVMSFACWESLRIRKGAKAKELEPWLEGVEGEQCLSNYEEPKKETTEHNE